MTASNRHADALLTDHFTYTPLSLIDDIINAVNTIIYQALDAIEDGLLNVPAAQLGFKASSDSDGPEPSEAARDEIENGVHQLETLLESTVDKSFDKFEIWTLRNVLTVSEGLGRHVRLRHYEGLQLPIPATSATPESVQQLRRQLAETKKLNTALKSQYAKNAALITQLRTLTSPNPSASATPSLAFLKPSLNNNTDSPNNNNNLTTQSSFAATQLPALRQLVSQLRPKLDELRQMKAENLVRDGGREERRRYIDGGVRRVVERTGVVGRGEGDLKAGEGERRDREEVEGLEGVVKGLGAGQA